MLSTLILSFYNDFCMLAELSLGQSLLLLILHALFFRYAGVLPPPDTIFVVNISSQKLIFHWNPVFPECQHVTYSITSSNCGDCLNTSSTSVTCSNFNVSTNATVCTLTVRSIVCANIVGDEATSVNVFLKGIQYE